MLDGLELMSAFAHNMDNYGDKDTETTNLENYTGNIFLSLYINNHFYKFVVNVI